MSAQRTSVRKWYQTSKALACGLSILVLPMTMIDGIDPLEVGALLVVLAVGIVLAHLNDQLNEQVARMHGLMDEEKEP